MKRITKSRQFLEQACRVSEVDGKFYQQTVKVGLKELKPFTSIAKHKYGIDQPYEYIAVYNYEKGKPSLMSYHSFLYAWYKGEVPAGYDVDHIDGDTMNNHIDNLQLLTHAENIKKRGGGKNQWTAAKENGLTVDTSNYKRKEKGYKNQHSTDFYKKQTERKINETKQRIQDLYESKHSMDYIVQRVQPLHNELEKLLETLKKIDQKIV